MSPEKNSRNSGTIESLISYSGESEPEHVEFNLALFEALNARYAAKRVVAAPRTHDTSYTTSIGEKRASTLDRKIGLRGLRVLELGCGDGMLSRVLAKDYGCEVVGVDIQAYDAWTPPAQGNLTHLVHDVTAADNSLLGTFDRVVSFAVMEHVVHPHAALQAVYAMLKPGGKAYIYANLYRGAKASHRYREVFFPWPHLLFEASVWRAFYSKLLGEEKQAAWVNKLTYDQYIAIAGRLGFKLVEHFPSAPFFDGDFYKEFEYQLAAYPKFDLMHDFIHLVLEKPDHASLQRNAVDRLLRTQPAVAGDPQHLAFWNLVSANQPEWEKYRERWQESRQDRATAIVDKVPWVTFPAIDFLHESLRPTDRVFEWGSGGSTLFFAERARSVVSIEHHRTWFDEVRQVLHGSGLGSKTDYRLIEPTGSMPDDWRFASGSHGDEAGNFQAYVEVINTFPDGEFDLVAIDGGARLGCLDAAVRKVAPGGLLMLNNANYPKHAIKLSALRETKLDGWEETYLAGPGPYSRTPAWATVVWRHPAAKATSLVAGFDAIRAEVVGTVLRPYDQLSYWPQFVDDAVVEDIVAGRPFSMFEFRFANASDFFRQDQPRSQLLLANSWDHLEPVFQYASDRSDGAKFRLLCDLVVGWLQSRDKLQGAPGGPQVDIADHGLLHSDTALGNRFYKMAYLVDRALKCGGADDNTLSTLVLGLREHLSLLEDQSNRSDHSNHGLFQALAIISGGTRLLNLKLFGPERLESLIAEAIRSMDGMLSRHFAADGSHREHSVSYHLVVAYALKWAVDKKIVAGAIFAKTYERAIAAGAWFYDASGRIANFGDSDLEPDYPFTRHFQKKGKAGVHHMATFSEGGYWFVKGGGKKDAYVAQSCAFHSRTHKQADSGTFIWRDRGKHILIDSGRYGYVGRTEPGSEAFRNGYWYSDPRRRYVESTRTHNTVSIDGQDHPRFRSKPFGSGIIASAQKHDVYACESSIKNLQRATHSRVLAARPGQWLLCLDTIRMRDRDQHDIQQHFHLHPDWSLEERNAGSLVFRGHSGLTLHATTVFGDNSITDFARGRGNPEVDEPEHLFGWWSPRHMQIEPCNSFTVSTRGNYVSLASLFTFEPVQIDRAYSGFNASRRRYRFRWSGAAGAETFSFERSTDDGTSTLAIL